jgi:F0F1-type ATP synthase assembly protein I
MTPAGGQSPNGRELLGLGMFLAGAVVIPLVAGVLLDGALKTGPIFALIGLALGVAAAVAGGYVRFKRYL